MRCFWAAGCTPTLPALEYTVAFVKDPGVSVWCVNRGERKLQRLHFIFSRLPHLRFAGGSIRAGSWGLHLMIEWRRKKVSKPAFYLLTFSPSQVHRQAKALRRLSHYLRSHKLRADQHMGFFVPLIYSYILDKRYAKSGKVFNFLIHVDCSAEVCSHALVGIVASAVLFIANLCIVWALKASMSAW